MRQVRQVRQARQARQVHNITYEKQYYFPHPYMIKFNASEFGTWSYFVYIKSLIGCVEALGGTLDGPPTSGLRRNQAPTT